MQGARSNFEGGPSALAAGLTGRTPRYGFHLDRHRVGTRHFEVRHQPRDLADWARWVVSWAAHQQLLGRAVITGLAKGPNSDELKHFGAALASFGSVAMFHIPGTTPEAATLADAFAGGAVRAAEVIGAAEFDAFSPICRKG